MLRKRKGDPIQVKMNPENSYQKMEHEFNEYGQTVDNNSDKFASIDGAIV